MFFQYLRKQIENCFFPADRFDFKFFVNFPANPDRDRFSNVLCFHWSYGVLPSEGSFKAYPSGFPFSYLFHALNLTHSYYSVKRLFYLYMLFLHNP